MRTDSPRIPWMGLLLTLVLLFAGCASRMPPPGLGMNLRYTPREAAGPGLAASPGSAKGTAWQSALAAHLAFRGAVGDVSGSTRRVSSELSRLKTSHLGIAGKAAGLFVRYVEYGAGMNEPPRHHVLPKEFREWFEKRGFTGELDIDQFCVESRRGRVREQEELRRAAIGHAHAVGSQDGWL
jgi:hypothetical protein